MHELFLRRRENLRQLVKARGGQKKFLEEVGHTKGWLSQLIGKTPERDLSEKIAREIEHKIGIAQVRIPRHPGHRSALMADSIPP